MRKHSNYRPKCVFSPTKKNETKMQIWKHFFKKERTHHILKEESLEQVTIKKIYDGYLCLNLSSFELSGKFCYIKPKKQSVYFGQSVDRKGRMLLCFSMKGGIGNVENKSQP